MNGASISGFLFLSFLVSFKKKAAKKQQWSFTDAPLLPFY
jgi:hypothetical protein